MNMVLVREGSISTLYTRLCSRCSKSRLLKPSIILPMGHHLAGSHHLKILAKLLQKINMDFDKKILIIKINRTLILSHVLLVHLF